MKNRAIVISPLTEEQKVILDEASLDDFKALAFNGILEAQDMLGLARALYGSFATALYRTEKEGGVPHRLTFETDFEPQPKEAKDEEVHD